MNHSQCNQHNENKNFQSTDFSAQSSQPVEDILSRMDRLRALAKVQNTKLNSTKRRQFSFAF
ncbi:hypothetical protein [Paraglaciecola hydrolytica]|uniref:Uncharacterized protein n=1 Tax=Paraglaciecola hydrolytica TaxID=1799789 RepID=A0A136A080_9ALTE|nr:hypothetical protein [Paraglaciecola hydrolytica]KXI28560.1 hypothetical protein AX660_15845 [Paraglaciecola hydrolytica]